MGRIVIRLRMPTRRLRTEVTGMQPDHSSREKQAARGASSRRGPRAMLAAARRSKGLVLAAVAVFAVSACASSLPPSGANANNANACTGPVSYCNIFFGS
jgi:hypothetical protein